MQLVALIKKHGFAWLDFCLKLGSCFFLLSACENATPIVSQNLLKDFNIRSSALYQLSKVPFSALPGWKAGRQNELIPVFLKSCEKTKRQQPNKKVGKLAKMGLVKDWIKICKIAAKIDFTNIIKARFLKQIFNHMLMVIDGNLLVCLQDIMNQSYLVLFNPTQDTGFHYFLCRRIL